MRSVYSCLLHISLTFWLKEWDVQDFFQSWWWLLSWGTIVFIHFRLSVQSQLNSWLKCFVTCVRTFYSAILEFQSQLQLQTQNLVWSLLESLHFWFQEFCQFGWQQQLSIWLKQLENTSLLRTLLSWLGVDFEELLLFILRWKWILSIKILSSQRRCL